MGMPSEKFQNRNSLTLIGAPLVVVFFMLQAWGGALEETVKAFESRPDYVRPFATMAGSMTNAGWYLCSSLNKNFNFSVSIPISLIYLNNQDREYSGSYIDEGCEKCMQQKAVDPSVNCEGCVECQQFNAPTIFGSIHTPDVHKSIIDLHGNVIGQLPPEDPFSDGIKDLAAVSMLPFLTVQAAFSMYYTQLTLRYIGIPAIKGVSFSFPGVGLQHDFHRFFPSWPVSLSLAAHMTFLSAAWKPGEDVEGTLNLSGLSSFIGILAGYKIAKFLEVFLETGWNNCAMTPSGKLTITDDDGGKDVVEPHQSLSGRNGFRLALNFSFPIGYNPVIGGIAGAQWGNVINVLSYKSKNDKE
jgi:hypothetical protein